MVERPRLQLWRTDGSGKGRDPCLLSEQYRLMLEENLDDYIEHFARYMQTKN